MGYYIFKIIVTTGLVILISELSKRNSLAGAILASVPLVSVLAIIWIYIDTKDAHQVGKLAQNIFWMVIPSLALFISLPLLLKAELSFYIALGISIALTITSYFIMLYILNHIGVKF